MAHHAEQTTDPRLSARTRAIALGRPHAPDDPLNVPLVPATSFVAGPGVGYSRAGNPSWAPFEEIIGSLEGGQGVSFGSGMAAISASLDVLLAESAKPVPVVAAPVVHYSGSRLLLAELARQGRIELRAYASEAGDLTAVDGADVVLVETPANPTMEITDIAKMAAASDARVLCDNTYATPLGCQPLSLGADVVVHSASKYLAGHSDALIGIAVTADATRADHLHRQRTLRGAVPGVLEAWLATRGVRTLPLRWAAASANAQVLAERLVEHPDVAEVRYPGLESDPGHEVATRQMTTFGAIITFRPAGGADRAARITESTRLWLHATSIGGVESTLERRRRHADESPDTPVDLIRLSVGCEDVDDLWRDLAQALTETA